MSLAFYLDDNIGTRAIVSGLARAAIKAETSDEARNRGTGDDEHLRFAAERGLVLVTKDRGDFAALHWAWIGRGAHHAGVVIVSSRLSLGDTIRSLTELSAANADSGLADQIIYLPSSGRP